MKRLNVILFIVFSIVLTSISQSFTFDDVEEDELLAVESSYLYVADDGVLLLNKEFRGAKFYSLPDTILDAPVVKQIFFQSNEPGLFFLRVEEGRFYCCHFGRRGWTISSSEDFVPDDVKRVEDGSFLATVMRVVNDDELYKELWSGIEKSQGISWTLVSKSPTNVGSCLGSNGRSSGIWKSESWQRINTYHNDDKNYDLMRNVVEKRLYQIVKRRKKESFELPVFELSQEMVNLQIEAVFEKDSDSHFLLSTGETSRLQGPSTFLCSYDGSKSYEFVFEDEWKGRGILFRLGPTD